MLTFGLNTVCNPFFSPSMVALCFTSLLCSSVEHWSCYKPSRLMLSLYINTVCFVVYLCFLLLFQHSLVFLVSFCPFLASLIQVHVCPDAKSGPGEHQHHWYSWNPVWRETEDKQRSDWRKLTTLNTLTHKFYRCCVTEIRPLCSLVKKYCNKGPQTHSK